MPTEQTTSLALPMSPLRYFYATVLAGSLLILPGILDLELVPRFLALFGGLLLLVYQLVQRKLHVPFQLNAVSASYLLFGLCVLLSCTYATCKPEAIVESGRTLGGIAIFFAAAALWQKHGEQFTRTLGKLSVIATGLTVVPVLFQLARLRNFSHDSLYQITGLNGHKNLVSSFLFLQLFFLMLGYRHGVARWKQASAIGLVLVVLLLAVLRTKAVWLGAACALLVFLLVQIPTLQRGLLSQKWPLLKLAGVLLLLNLFFLKLFPPGLQQLLESKQTTGQETSGFLDTERLMVWHKTYHLIDQHTLLGLGAGNWQVHFPDAGLDGLWRVEDLNVTFQRPHNDFLWILAENGLVGFNLYLIFLLLIYHTAARAIRTQANATRAREVVIACAILGGYLVVSFFDFPKERIEHLIWFNLLLAFLYAGSGTTSLPQVHGIDRLKPTHLLVVAATAAFFLLCGTLRFKGEYFTRLLYDNRTSNPTAVIHFGTSACSFAYSLDPTSIPLLWYTGNARALNKDYAGALCDFEEAYKQHPYNRNVLNDLASACSLLGDKTSAIAMYKEAARISPRFDEPKLNLAAIYLSENNPTEALVWLNQVLHDSERRAKYTQMANSLLNAKR